jgi:sulfatase maturation enzyme AslB (radical SAM superfamily)
LPHLTGRYNLNFYGGEPLLCFDLILQILAFLEEKNRAFKKKVRYSITTNGSLVDGDIARALSDHRFSVLFSFDGLAQDVHRKPGNVEEAVFALREIQKCSGIRLEVNSVFTPETVGLLSESVEFILNLGVEDIHLSLSYVEPWKRTALGLLDREMTNLRKILVSRYRKTAKIPLVDFREKEEGFFYCAAGQDRLTVTPQEKIWGCDLFASYFEGKEELPGYGDYFFGDLDTFAGGHQKIFPRISSNYARLRLDNYQTPQMKCLFCENLEECAFCPIAAAFSGYPPGRVPPFVCEIQKIKIREIKKFREEIKRD